MNIPGFQIERALGRGGPTQVFLALQLQPFRRVALKVARCREEDASSRLERLEGHPALAPGFRHPHIAHVHGAGAHGPFLYLVVEYLEGGNLDQKLTWGIGLDELTSACCDLCHALDHGHGLGVVHGRIRPSNILFRSDIEAVLADFCPLAIIADSSAPADLRQRDFLSPEQMAGRPADARSDLYSLGASLYTALTGEVFQHRSSTGDAAIGGGHDKAKLPAHLKPLQPILDQALARDADLRPQTGAAFKATLETVRDSSVLNGLSIKTGVVTEREIPAPDNALHRAAHGGSAPVRNPRKWWHSPVVAASALVAVAALGVVYLAQQQPWWVQGLLARVGLAEDPAVQIAWSNAQSLHQDPNQNLSVIVTGYRAVLALDVAHGPAREAITSLARNWSQGIQDALARNDLEGAAVKLAQMEAAFPEEAGLVELQRQLANRQAVETLLASTAALLRSQDRSQIPVATVAIQSYQEILRLEPGHTEALAQLTALAEHYASLAQSAVAQGDVDKAIIYLERATTANEALPMLAVVGGRIQQAATALATIEELLRQAGAYRAEGFLVHPPGGNAAELYHRVLATAPDNGIALQGLNEVTSRLLNDATQMLEAGDLDAVSVLIDQASAAGINAAALRKIKDSLDQELEAVVVVNRRLQEARALLEKGFVTEPQGNNAVAQLREIQRLDPDNAEAARLLGQAASRLVKVAQDAFDAGLGDLARHYLDLALTVTPDEAEWRALRQSWQ